jgi:hypothetical protein
MEVVGATPAEPGVPAAGVPAATPDTVWGEALHPAVSAAATRRAATAGRRYPSWLIGVLL